MRRWLLFLIVVLLSGSSVADQPERPPATAIAFPTPLAASMKMANGSVVEGRLTGFDVEGVHITTSSGKNLFFSIRQVRSVQCRSGAFQFNADSDSALTAIQRALARRPVRVVEPEETESAEDPEPPHKARPKAATLPCPHTDSPSSTAPVDATNPDPSPGTLDEFRCAQCEYSTKADNATAVQFKFCPKCGAPQSSEPAASSGRAMFEAKEDGSDPVETPAFVRTPAGTALFLVLTIADMFIVLRWVFDSKLIFTER